MFRRLTRSIVAVAAAAALAVAPALGIAQEAPGRVQVAELSRETESAIDRGLRYLDSTQNADGSWGATYKTAETSLALMAFMVKGHFPGRGHYGARLDRAVEYLIQRGREKGGYLGSQHHGMYEHGLATLALSEVWGESDNDKLRDALKQAVDVIFRSQAPNGGWRYAPQPGDHDISATVMQIMALASAKEAGIHIPDKVLDQAVRYVLSCQHPLGGFSYQPGGVPGFARTAAGVMSLYMAGERNSPAILRGLDYLEKTENGKFNNMQWYFYGHYYAIQAMYQAGDAHYQAWYPQIREALLARQRPDGSWSGGEGGTTPAFATSMSILILGVPYRFLPIYQR